MAHGRKTRSTGAAAFLVAILAPGWVHASEDEWAYKIQTGDTLIGLGRTYLEHPADWPKVRQLNKVRDPHRLKPGSELRIPVALLKKIPSDVVAVRVQGDVRRIKPGEAAQRLEADTTLATGDTLITGADSSVTLRLADGSRLLVHENSELKIDALHTYGRTDALVSRLHVNKGRVDSRVTPLKNPASRYEIQTPSLMLGVRGTDFRVSAEESASRSEVLEGLVAADAEGQSVSIPSGFGSVAEKGKPPQPPKALLPPPGITDLPALLDRIPLRFRWSPMKEARSYRAQIFAKGDFDQLLLDGAFASSEAKWADLPDGQYTLRVRGIDDIGLEGLNADHHFVLKARPEPPFVSAPANGAKLMAGKTDFHWTESTQAASYHFQLAADPAFAQLVAEQPGLTGAGYSAELPPGHYYWRIASRTATGDRGPFSDAYSIITRPAPPDIPPAAVSDDRLMFQWPAGENGQSYQFQLARDKSFTSIVVDQTIAASQIVLPRPPGGEYFAHVRTIDADGFTSPFGATQRIEIPQQRRPWWLLIPLLLPFIL